MVKGAQQSWRGEESGTSRMSIPDSVLFPEAQGFETHQRPSRPPHPDPDRVGSKVAYLGEECSGKKSADKATNGAIEGVVGGLRSEMEERRRHGACLQEPVQPVLGRHFSMQAHGTTSSLPTPLQNVCLLGTGHLGSLQELLIGFTTGAFSLFNTPNEHVAQPIANIASNSNAQQMNVQLANAGSSHQKTDILSEDEMFQSTDASDELLCSGQKNLVKLDVVKDASDKIGFQGIESDSKYPGNEKDGPGNISGSEADNEETDDECYITRSNDVMNIASNDTDDDYEMSKYNDGGNTSSSEELKDTPRFVPTEEDLASVDWERLYSTGELVQKNPCEPKNGMSNIEEYTGEESLNLVKTVPDNNGTWKKRRRDKALGERKEFRLPRGMGAIERAMRQFSEKKEGHIFEPRVGLEFDSEAEAFEYYNLYSWEVGFGIRLGNRDANRSGFTRVRDLVCVKQGYDKRTKSITQRSHCKAMIRLHRTEDDGWFITTIVKEHNHELSETDEQKREWKSHRVITQSVRDMIKNLREHNIKLSRVHCIMGSLYGSMDNIPFTRRSLKIICAQIAREQRDDDIKKTLELFRLMRSEDPGFQFSVEVDEFNQTKTLIWATGRSRSNYSCFGDVVTFDTTYCTNIYKMPFGLFVGVNNHFQTTIFAGVLMTDETAESFKWVFNEFLALMGGVHPQTILTDQCRAMEIALKVVMPGTTHLWCRWHVFRDARIELGPVFRENNSFKDEFHRVITEMYTVDEFTHEWTTLLKKYDLESHHYMVRAYDKRKKWAKCYNSGTFCARMTSTQRSESANHMLKTWVPRNSPMNRFVADLNKLLYQMYAEEERAEHETKQHIRVNKILWDVEKHAMKIYTKKVFAMFSAEMEKTRRYGVPETTDNETFIVTHTKADYVQRYRRAQFKVISKNNGAKYECQCGLYEHFGILCCHILRVFIHTGVSEIPEAHIMTRWTKKARDLAPENLRVKCSGSNEDHAKLFIQSKIHGKALEVARKGKYDFEACDIVMKYLQEAERKVDEYILKCDQQAKGSQAEDNNFVEESMTTYTSSDSESTSVNRFGASGSCAGMSDEEVMNIKAPPRIKKRGAPTNKRYFSFLDKIDGKTKRKMQKDSVSKLVSKAKIANGKEKVSSTKITAHCTKCKMPGHNRTRCPNNAPPARAELVD